jgi:hypothetical protein
MFTLLSTNYRIKKRKSFYPRVAPEKRWRYGNNGDDPRGQENRSNRGAFASGLHSGGDMSLDTQHAFAVVAC